MRSNRRCRIGNGPKSPGRAGGGPSSLGVQAGIEATHRQPSNASESRPGLSAGGSNRFSRRLKSGAFGAGGRTGTRSGNRRNPGFRHPTTGRAAPGFAVHRAPPTPRGVPRGVKRRAAGRPATHSGLTRRSTGTRRRVLWFHPRGAAGPVNLNVRLKQKQVNNVGEKRKQKDLWHCYANI
jgi:hypothetical protein